MRGYLKYKFKTITQGLRFKLSSSNNPLFIGYYKYLYRPKPNTISEFLDKYSKSKNGNVFVIQVGANDGINNDPVHKYIKRDKWSGILIEPQKYVFEKYLKKVYSKHKNIETLCSAIGEEDGSQILYKIGWCNMRWATGLSSFQRESLQKAYDSGLVKNAAKKFDLTLPSNTSQYIVEETVSVISPAILISKYKVFDIDLLQIDVEGYDYEVIKMFDLTSTKPKNIVYENIHLSEQDKINCEAYLLSLGYKIKEFDSNTLAEL